MSYFQEGSGFRSLRDVEDDEEFLDDPAALMSAPVGGEGQPSFVWPILPPPHSTPGQLFTAKLPSGKQHNALDMGTGGDTVLATAAGVVTAARASGDARGNMLLLDLGNGWEVRHYHLASFNVAKGDSVTQGQQIAVAGKSGLPKNNPHLHFEIRRGGVAVDPQTLLPDPSTVPGAVAAETNWPLLIGGAALTYFALKG